MTKSEFLNRLSVKFAALDERERERFLSFYEEMIEDRMEDGISEAEAVGSEGDLDEIAREILQGTPHSGQTKTTMAEKSWEAGTSTVKKVTVDAENIALKLSVSADDQVHFSYVENEQGVFTQRMTSDGEMILTYRSRDSVRRWFELFMSFTSGNAAPILVKVPERFIGNVELKTRNARIECHHPGFQGDLTLSTSNGRLQVENLRQSGVLEMRTSNGRIYLEDIHADSLKAETNNGRMSLRDIVCRRDAYCRTSNGRIEAVVVRGDTVTLMTSNGGISITGCVGKKLTKISTSNASVTGTMPGAMRDYGIVSHTSNGSNTLPSKLPGGETQLEVTTSNGSITLGFEK